MIADHEAEQALVYLAVWVMELSPRDTGLRAEDFDHPGWREVWRSALAVEAKGAVPDALSVMDHMKARGALADAGGPAALMASVNNHPPVWDAAARVARVKDTAARRSLKSLGLALANAAHDMNLPTSAAALDYSARLAAMAATGNRPTATFRNAVEDFLDQLHAIRAGTYEEYLPTGIEVWDQVLQGLQRAKLGLLGAYPSVGKGAVMLRAILNAALLGRKPGIFSLEDLKVWMAKRYVAERARVPVRRLMQKEPLPEHYETSVDEAVMAAHPWADQILIEDSSGLSDDQIAVMARQWVVREGCTEIWIDNASEVDISKAPGDRHELKTGRMVRLFRDVAKDLNVPVWLLVHFKQPKDTTTDEPRFIVPTSSMWKNSGAFAEASRNSVALFLDKEAPEEWVCGKVTKQTEGEKDSLFYMRFDAMAGIVSSTGGRRHKQDTGYTRGDYQEENR